MGVLSKIVTNRKRFHMSNDESGTPARRFGVLRRAGRYLLGIIGVSMITGAPVEADAATAQRALEARVEKVREAMREEAAASPRPEAQKLAQWWNNWPNWGNWGNWPNWPNWGNWFNR